MSQIKSKGTLIQTGNTNIHILQKNSIQSLNIMIENNIYSESPYFNNPQGLKIQLENQFLLVPLSCERTQGKIEEKTVHNNGDLYVSYVYPFTGSSQLFNLINFPLQQNTMRVEYKMTTKDAGNLYLQLYIPYRTEMSAFINSKIEYLFQYIAQVISLGEAIKSYNHIVQSSLDIKMQERINTVKTIIANTSNIPEK
jgi:hypothetical protein